jgi:hypothetical protein
MAVRQSNLLGHPVSAGHRSISMILPRDEAFLSVSTHACDVSFMHASVAIITAILRSSLFCMVDLFCRGKSSCSSGAA